jgi:hypothetical protein
VLLDDEWVGSGQNPMNILLGNSFKDGVQFAGARRIQDQQAHAENGGRSLNFSCFGDCIGIAGIREQGNGCACRYQFTQHLEPLWSQLHAQRGRACDVAARFAEAWNQAPSDRVTPDAKDNRDCLGRRLGGKRHCGAAHRHEHGDASFDQIA